MKIRLGFVSNSSSSSFILDLRKPGSLHIYKELEKTNIPRLEKILYSRSTCYGTKEDIEIFLNSLKEYQDEYFYWLEEQVNTLGIENCLYIRDADEDDTRLEINIPNRLIVSQMDFH